FLAGAGFFFCICALINATLLGLGRSSLQLKLSLTLGGATIAVVGIAAPFGVTAVSAALAGAIGLVCALYVHQLARHLSMPRRPFVAAFGPALCASAAMSAALLG